VKPVRFLSACLMVMLFCSSLNADTRPNVLFIAVDDLNDWIGCLGGHPDGRSPHIDRLAARGTLFTRSYCSAPACNPSRVAMMTGMLPSQTGVYVNPQPWRPVLKETVTLPQHLRKHGYYACGAGKIYHGRYEDDRSWDDYQKKGNDPRPTPTVLQHPRSRAGGVVWGVLDVDDSAMADYRTADYAIDFLSEQHDKPFFLACGIFRPHMPWQVPRKYYDLFPPEQVTLPRVLAGDLEDVPPAGIKMAKPQGDHANIRKTGNWRHAVGAYLASITFADGQVGRVLDALENSPHAQNTIIVLWGDHGWHLGEKEHWRKFSLWEEACRAPLMIVAPGVTTPGVRCGRTVDLVDVFPTLCDLCGIPRRSNLDGQSLVPLLRNAAAEWNHPALTTHGKDNHSIRTERWRYTRYANGDEELYDHHVDPMEWKNLAQEPSLLSVREELADLLPSRNAPNAPFDQSIRRKNKADTGDRKNNRQKQEQDIRRP